MVSFYNADVIKEDGSVPVGTDCTLSPVGPRDISSKEPSVNRLVCSPDLPVFDPATSSTTATAATTTTTDKMYECSFCHKLFPQKNTYQNHLRSHSKDGDDPYQCNICGKTFAVPARLTRHYRTHTGEKPYHCEYCSKSFSVKENLSVHRRIHTKERPYKCEVCERAFEHSGKLHRHMRIHTGERPHKCSVCAKTFIQSGQLVIHMRTHTGEKPYVCKTCGKGFTCSKQLKVHTRTHTGEKPYNCEICGKSFGYNHVLKLHQVAHYGEKVYKCTICNETFTSKKTMELHIKSHSEQQSQQTTQIRMNHSTEITETLSCGSSVSDKENKEAESDSRHLFESEKPQVEIILQPPIPPIPPTITPKHPNMKELCYYFYYPKVDRAKEGQGVNPALLAAAAAAKFETEGARYENESTSYEQEQLLHSAPIEPSVYLCPDPLGSMQRQSTSCQLEIHPQQFLNHTLEVNVSGDEKGSLSPVLTPPSSNSVSPSPSSSPDPIDLAPHDRQLSLPPRKRSKMILKSLETETISRLRQNSVIHFARAAVVPNS